MPSAAERIPRLHDNAQIVHIRHDFPFLTVDMDFVLRECLVSLRRAAIPGDYSACAGLSGTLLVFRMRGCKHKARRRDLILRAVSRPRSFCRLLFRFCPAVFMAANADVAFFCPAVFSTLSLCSCKRSRGFFCCAVFASTKSKRGVFDLRRDCFDASIFAGSVVGGMRKATENY